MNCFCCGFSALPIDTFCLLRISFAFSDVFRYVDCRGLYDGLYVVRVRDVLACVVLQAKLLLAFLVSSFLVFDKCSNQFLQWCSVGFLVRAYERECYGKL